MRVVKFFILLVSASMLFLQVRAQAPVKSKSKPPKALISISHQDVKGAALNVGTVRQLEKSYNSVGDKRVMESIFYKSFLYNPANTPAPNIDTAFNAKINSCPIVGQLRVADPYLVLWAIGFQYMNESGLGLNEGYEVFTKWHLANIPNAPGIGSNNEVTPGLAGNDVINWVDLNIKQWVNSYPEQYNFAINYYNAKYAVWKDTVKSVPPSHRSYFKSLLAKFDFINPDDFSIFFELNTGVHGNVVIPSDSLMRNNTEQFVRDAYEALLLRTPTNNEVQELSRMIKEDKKITPEVFYYAIMSSDEYRFY